MIVERGCAQTRVLSATEGEDAWLRNYLTFESANSYWIRKAGGSGKVLVYNQFSKKFPSGLLDRVVADAAKDGVRVEVVDRRSRPCEPLPASAWPNPELATTTRPYQLEAARAAIRHNPGLVWLPTGSGKTRVVAVLVSALPCRWLVVVPEIHLLNQMAAELSASLGGEEVGTCGDDRWSVRRVTVSTYQTLHAGILRNSDRVLDLLASAQGVALDEAHMAAADTIADTLLRADSAYWRVGVSATPLARGDRKSTMVVACLGPVLYRQRTQEMVEAGYLAKTTVRMVPVRAREGAEAGARTPAAAYKRDIVDHAARNAALTEVAAHLAAKPCLVFVARIAHGRALAKAIAKLGASVEFIWSTASARQRADVVKRLGTGAVEVVVASPVFNQGVDIPSLASGVNAAAGRGVIASLQRLGRGSRTDGGRKAEFEFWDVLDLGHARFTPQAKARMRTYVREGHVVVEREVVLPMHRDNGGVA